MKKSVRLYNMIEYCNENRNFKLNDLMSEFNISRSTALRDIKEIEALEYLYIVIQEKWWLYDHR